MFCGVRNIGVLLKTRYEGFLLFYDSFCALIYELFRCLYAHFP